MRAEGDLIKINEYLTPLSWLYGLGVGFRNALFEMGVLKSKAFDIPVISVGNITVGGSGKTPHVEYLVQLLRNHVKVAVLSRGYKRKSRGYQLAGDTTRMEQIGDESFQLKTKYPDIHVAVDGNRCRGISRIVEDEATRDTDVILLDDAFQHRYVKPGINILLVDYHRLIIYDKLLPAGRLREPQSGKNRADIVIITKCPKDLKPVEYRVLTKAMDLFPYQSLFFSTIAYEAPRAVFKVHTMAKSELKPYHVLLLTGIASPKQMELDICHGLRSLTHLTFSDHHLFTSGDIQKINSAFAALPEPRLIITTEKDAARLRELQGFSEEVRNSLYVLPIRMKFMLDEAEQFNNKIIDYVRKNSRNSILAQSKDDHQARNSHHSRNRTRTISFRDNK